MQPGNVISVFLYDYFSTVLDTANFGVRHRVLEMSLFNTPEHSADMHACIVLSIEIGSA